MGTAILLEPARTGGPEHRPSHKAAKRLLTAALAVLLAAVLAASLAGLGAAGVGVRPRPTPRATTTPVARRTPAPTVTPEPTKPPQPTPAPTGEPGAGPVVPLPPVEGAVALTFDDGPHPRYTPQLLDVLDAHGIKATFFVVGQEAERYPDLVRSIVNFPSAGRDEERSRSERESSQGPKPILTEGATLSSTSP